jgi:site-specific DNA-methyltransferase (adenine-specific)
MEFMRDLPDNHYDLAIVDPPYGIGDFWRGGDNSAQKRIIEIRKTEKSWNEETPTQDYWDQLKRTSENQIVWGWNYYTDQLGSSDSLIVWHKKMGSANYSQCEIAWASFGHKIKFYQLHLNECKHGQGGRTHPCQKPVSLYKWLLANYAKPGDTIFDSHVGSGSIRIACHDLDFEFEGCEIDKDYWEAQEARFKKHTDQLRLF